MLTTLEGVGYNGDMQPTSVADSLVQFFSSATAGLSWLDYIIIAVFIFYAIEGILVGFIASLFDLISFVVSFSIAITFYGFFGKLLLGFVFLPQGFANAIGFFIAAFLSEVFIRVVLRRMYRYMQVRSTGPHIVSHDTSSSFLSSLDHFFGIFPAIVSSYILLSFLLTLLVSLPLSPFLTRAIGASRFGNLFAGNTLGFEKKINMVFGNAVHETLTFLTVEPESNESVVLHFATTNVTPDENAEQKMFLMVNSERTSRGLPVLLFSDNLQSVARAHAADMFAKGYFSHYTPNGLSPFDRMSIAGISYAAAGENLALAPNTDLAMNGLMQSPGHKANILSVDFGKIGVGVIDGGIYGEMFAQEFTN